MSGYSLSKIKVFADTGDASKPTYRKIEIDEFQLRELLERAYIQGAEYAFNSTDLNEGLTINREESKTGIDAILESL